MQLEEIIARLNVIKTQILGWPDNVINENPLSDPDVVFLEIEENLKQLLEVVKTMDHSTQEKMNSVFQEFRSEIVEHYQKTQEKLEELRAELGQGKQHIKAIKAYSKQ